jgi:hypothetical protein
MAREYTEEELESIINNLPPKIGETFVSLEMLQTVQDIATRNGLHIDQIELLLTEVNQVLLGMSPSSSFTSELQSVTGIDNETAQKITTEVDQYIFMPIRQDLIALYSRTEDAINTSPVGVGAIYDEAIDSIHSDPYHEDVGGRSGRGSVVITEERLHLVDELFAPHQPKVRELTPADGSVRVQPEDAKHVPDLFATSPGSLPSYIINKATLAASEGTDAADTVIPQVTSVPPITVPIPVVLPTATAIEKSSATAVTPEQEQAPAKSPEKLQITITKSQTPGKVLLTVRKKQAAVSTAPAATTTPMQGMPVSPAMPKPSTYNIDPYKEVV